MASTEARYYSCTPGISAEQIGVSVVNFLRDAKGQEARGHSTPQGYYVQARSRTSGLADAAGLGTAIIVEIEANEFGEVSINAGSGKWSNRVGATMVGLAFFPLIALPAAGAVKQRQLIAEALDFIESYLATARPGVVAGISAGSQPVTGASTGSQPYGALVNPASSSQLGATCSKCGSTLASQMMYCPSCGASTQESPSCSECGAEVPNGTRFCPSCGARIAQGNACPACGMELQAGQRFCHKCGADTQG